MPSILIGIPVYAEPRRLQATLASLENSVPGARVVLLPDGADEETERALKELRDFPRVPADSPTGTADCFNRLIHFDTADFYLLLESGAVPAPGWLDHLLAAFQRFPRCGLAGPSTNAGRNEQRIFSTVDGTQGAVAATGRIAARRFGATCRSLEPLHSLADFCYMVRREVIQAVGDADPAYGLGPGWEMDYNIRAHRAGFLGLWACAAYVHRAPGVECRAREEAARAEASQQRYKDKFCGLRLRGLKHDYRPHCRGDACPNFAPANLITIRPLPAPTLQTQCEPAAEAAAAVPAAGAALEISWPLVSCIMPTCNRRKFIPDSLRCFFAQDYPNLELIVVDDGSDPVVDLFPDDPRIHYFRLPDKLNVGAKRNFACRQSNGDFIAHWDDDDWYPPSRIRRQVSAFTDSNAQICGTTTMYYRDMSRNQAFRYSYRGPACAWMGALMYRASVWRQRPFESIQVGEDVRFIAHVSGNARHDLCDPALNIGAIHDANASPKITTGPFWTREPMENVTAVVESAAFAAAPCAAPAPCPIISCIMPTHNRREWITRSIRCFLEQDYGNRELVIVDDGSDAIGDLVPSDPTIRYHRLDRRLTIGAKRNLACELAAGSLIAHWDDDDWYPSWRLSAQVAALESGDADLCGTSQLYYLADTGRKAYRYIHTEPLSWVAGNTFAYKKSFWQRSRFPDLHVGEDSTFLGMAGPARTLDLKDARLCVASIHGQNTSPKNFSGRGWQPVPLADVQQLLNGSLAGRVRNNGNFTTTSMMHTNEHRMKTHSGYRIAQTADLRLTEFAAFNRGQAELPHMRRWELPWALFAAQLSNTMAVLDCTINPANFAERMARLYPNVQYRHVSPVQQGAFRLPFGVPDESFDRVFCINTLEHLVREQREALMADLARKLKPGGRLVLTSDYYFDSSWTNRAFLDAAVMRSDGAEFFGGWNKTTPGDLSELCHRHGLVPMDSGTWENPNENDPGCYRNPAPFSHAAIAGVFSKGAPAESRGRRIVLALLTWNTRDISIESVRAYLREARMLARLGCEPCLCVCDNGSDDGTQEALRNLEPEIDVPYKLILNPHNAGNSIARNQIIDYMMESEADYVLFMDGDIEIVPFSSFAMFRYMENCGHRLGCIGADSASHTPVHDRTTPCLYTIDGMGTQEVTLVAWTQYGMFRRAVFEAGVRFDENGPFSGPGWGFEDNDLAFQMELKGFRNQRFLGMVYLHRAMQSSIRIMRRLGINPKALYDSRKQFVIDKWASVPTINSGPLALVRRAHIPV